MMTRKIFLTRLAGGGLGLVLGGCGGGGGGDGGEPVAPAGACSRFAFSANHGHSLSIPLADLDATTARTYSIRGSAPHDHPITLSPEQLAQLKAGQAIQLTTIGAGAVVHTHDVSGSCV